MKRIDYEEILDVFLWGLGKLTCPTLGNLLAGYEEYQYRHQPEKLFNYLTRSQSYQRSGHGSAALFAISPAGLRRVRTLSPETHWDTPWDGAWRVMTFDVPESQRKERAQLWRVLRARKLGCLQRSVWVWPHDLRPILKELGRVEGIPKCLCGFAARELVACTSADIVRSAWRWEEINRRQRGYLQQPATTMAAVNKAAKLPALGAIARAERQAYWHAFDLDPLLPRQLWPESYQGETVQNRHDSFRHGLGRRLARLAPPSPSAKPV